MEYMARRNKILLLHMCTYFFLFTYASNAFADVYRASAGRGISCFIGSEGCSENLATQLTTCSGREFLEITSSSHSSGKTSVAKQCLECDPGDMYIGDGKCLREVKCPAGSVFDSSLNKCKEPCSNGSTLNENGKCHKPPEEKHCGGKSSNPIDFSSAEKLRNEHVITAGTRDPLSFKLYYNNHTNNEKTAAGIVAHQAVPSTVLSTSTPIPPNNFAANYNQKGLLKSTVLANQYYGGIEQYWRHNYDDVLQIRGDAYQLHLANGQVRDFDGLGQSKTHPIESLLALNVNEESFTGYKWVNHKTGNERRFDNTGKLRKIITAASESTTLMYTNEQLTRIENQYGEYLTFEYTAFNTNSIYSSDDTTHALPTKVTGSNGRSASLEWNANFRGQTATFHMLTRITDATNGTATTARDFSYADNRWPASITKIHTVSNIASNTKILYAEFKYDDQGRAIYSSLANGAEAVTVDYTNDLTRTVTNALGKDATYTFEFIDGVKKLKKVVGEPTASCLRSEIEYVYNTNGTVFEKKQNDKKIRYTQYDTQGRELERIEAFGTPDARTIKTEWHPTLSKKVKVIDPKSTTVWEYFTDGRLKNIKKY